MSETKQRIIKPQHGFQEQFVRSNVDVVIGGGSVSSGKELTLDELVLTPYGWKRNGDLEVGDLVNTPFGKPVPVTAIFDHKDRDIFVIETADGRKAECGLEHLWAFRTKKQMHSYRRHKDVSENLTVADTRYIIDALQKGRSLYIPMPKAQEFKEKEFTTPPYVLGTRIGLDTQTPRNFIPEEYKWGSIRQRKELLAGLFDSGGYVMKNNMYSISTTSKKLADDIVYLCRSLGYEAKIKKDNTGASCSVRILTDDIIFTANKHKERYESNKSRNKVRHNRTCDHTLIVSVKRKDKADTRCIYIDDPMHLYICGDWLTTHNTFAAILSVAEPALDPNFRAVFLRNNLGDLKSGGGVLDDFEYVYGNSVSVIRSGDPHVDFASGATIDVTHVADQSKEKVLQRFKGRQYDMVYFDEMTGFTWECFSTICSRNRGKGAWTGKIRGTTNPRRSHWLRVFLDWYIGVDGYIRPDRNGKVRYFYINGDSVRDVVWGDTKEEVYEQCKISIDRKLANANNEGGFKFTYKDFIKSFTFYLGKMSENRAILESNSGYVGAVSMMGEKESLANLGNWNVDPEEDINSPIPPDKARQVFMNDPQTNNDKWITCDLADTGTDNFLALAWDGFHVFDILILTHSTPRQNAERLHIFAASHDIADCHIIYDAIRGVYINDYIPDAVPFVSYRAPLGLYARMAVKLKDVCYMRLAEVIKREMLSFDDKIAQSTYEHQNMKERITIQTEFLEECSVVYFKDAPGGKKALLSKKEMNQKLGKGRSMDLLDPCAMRMLPCLDYIYGEELVKSMQLGDYDEDNNVEYDSDETVNVFSEQTWF